MVGIGAMRTLAGLISRFQIAHRAGVTFKGIRRVYETCGYLENIEPEDYRERYERNGLAKRVVEAYPNDTWGGEPLVFEDEDPDVETLFEKEWDEFASRLNVVSTFRKADILARLGRFSIILIGAPGDLQTPLPKPLKLSSIEYLQPFSELDITVSEMDLVNQTQDRRFGLPNYYTVSRIGGIRVNVGRRVHWTRVLHFAEGQLDDILYGTPALKASWNDFDNLEKVLGAGSEAFWMRANQGMQVNVDPGIKLNDEAKKALEEELLKYQHGQSRLMKTRGVDITTLGSDVANFNPQVDSIITVIAGSQEIPKRILAGSEMGELASTQDRTNWGQRITVRRKNYATPMFFRQFIDRLIEFKALPEPTEYDVEWVPMASMDDIEKADLGIKYSTINKNYGKVVVKRSETREILGLEALDEAILDEEPEDDLVDDPEDGLPPVNDKVPIPDDSEEDE